VRRSTLQLGVQGGEIKSKGEKCLQLSVQIELYVFIYYINKHSYVDIAQGGG
jgi:hypothetical protein